MKKLLPDSLRKAWQPSSSCDNTCCGSDSDSSSCGCSSTAKSVGVDTADLAVDVFNSGYMTVSDDRVCLEAGCNLECLCCRGGSSGLQCCQQDACVDTADLPVDPENCWCRLQSAKRTAQDAVSVDVGTVTDTVSSPGVSGYLLSQLVPVVPPQPKPDLKRIRLKRRRHTDTSTSESVEASAQERLPPPSSFECAECGEQFTDKDSLSAHLQHLHMQSPDASSNVVAEGNASRSMSPCDDGDTASDSSTATARQSTEHRDSDGVDCAADGDSEAESGDKNTTSSKRTARKKISACFICDKSFSFAAALYNHALTAHRDHADQETLLAACRPSHVCGTCGKGFRCASALVAHDTVHSGSRSHRCSDCQRPFASRSSLNAHRAQQHPASGVGAPARFHCADCSASFTRRDSLEAHRRLHSGDRPFVCSQCGASFARRFSLRNHM